jgi:hypothetical protein
MHHPDTVEGTHLGDNASLSNPTSRHRLLYLRSRAAMAYRPRMHLFNALGAPLSAGIDATLGFDSHQRATPYSPPYTHRRCTFPIAAVPAIAAASFFRGFLHRR